MTRLRSVPTMAILVALGGCLFGRSAISSLPDAMYAHFGDVGVVQTAVIEGDLETAKTAAARVRDRARHEDIPSRGDAYYARLIDRADEVTRASTLQEAAVGTAEMAAACGNCHIALDRTAPFSLAASPPPAVPVAGHMLRHLWAADRLWEGLMGPSDDLWGFGALTLSGEALGFEEAAGSELVQELADRVHRLGIEADGAIGQGDRAEVYGRLLTTCSDCHRLLRLGGS